LPGTSVFPENFKISGWNLAVDEEDVPVVMLYMTGEDDQVRWFTCSMDLFGYRTIRVEWEKDSMEAVIPKSIAKWLSDADNKRNYARLMTEAEFQRAAYGRPGGGESRFPWGSDEPSARHGVFDFVSWDPQPAGSHPAGASAWGVEDLAGNGWEWTSSTFMPFPGFKPMASYPEYSADFFDGEHFVMKGASPATAHELLRPSFRNWFRARYPYVYATFRCAK